MRITNRSPLPIAARAIGVVAALLFVFDCALAGGSATADRFALTKADGQPVCGAFLRLLNDANLPPKSPICAIPITGSTPGFSALPHALLSETDAENLFVRVDGFVGSQVQITEPTPQMTFSVFRKWYGYNIFAWKFPRVTLANDGVKQDVLIWQGYGADPASVVVKCGETAMVHTRDYVYQPRQFGFIVSPNGQAIDERETKAFFGIKNDYNDTPKANGPHDFLELGSFVGIFKFADRYYIYALYQETGDFRGRRRNDPAMLQTIGVLRREGTKTIEECEIRDRDHRW